MEEESAGTLVGRFAYGLKTGGFFGVVAGDAGTAVTVVFADGLAIPANGATFLLGTVFGLRFSLAFWTVIPKGTITKSSSSESESSKMLRFPNVNWRGFFCLCLRLSLPLLQLPSVLRSSGVTGLERRRRAAALDCGLATASSSSLLHKSITADMMLLPLYCLVQWVVAMVRRRRMLCVDERQHNIEKPPLAS
jgi:hypothetical protein